MKNVLIIESSPRKGFSLKTAKNISEKLESKGIGVELISVRDLTVHACYGCCACLTKGSSFCPYHDDDAQRIKEKMLNADGVIYVTPNYSLNIPGNLKTLFDRLAYVFHRPRLFHKTCMAVVVQGVFGGGKIIKHINEVMSFWGMKTAKGIVVSGGIYPGKPGNKKIEEKDEKKLTLAIERYVTLLNDEKPQKPSLFKSAIFYMTRSSMKYFDEALEPDKTYYKEKGWLESDYYYPVRINPLRKLMGKLLDGMLKKQAKKM